jgi:hypothetical protein
VARRFQAAIVSAAVGLLAGLSASTAQADDETATKPETSETTSDGEADASDDAPKSAGTVDDGVLRYPPSSVRVGLLAGGVGLLGMSYGLTAMSSRLWPGVPGADAMLVPIAGPWVALGQSGCAADDTDGCTGILVVRTILLVLDGLAQAGSVGLIGEGLFMTTEADAPDAAAAPTIHVAPQLGSGRTGLSVVGTF